MDRLDRRLLAAHTLNDPGAFEQATAVSIASTNECWDDARSNRSRLGIRTFKAPLNPRIYQDLHEVRPDRFTSGGSGFESPLQPTEIPIQPGFDRSTQERPRQP